MASRIDVKEKFESKFWNIGTIAQGHRNVKQMDHSDQTPIVSRIGVFLRDKYQKRIGARLTEIMGCPLWWASKKLITELF